VVADLHEQTDTPDLQDPELAELQRSAQAPRLADDLVRSRHELGGSTDRQAWPTARLQRCRDPDLPDHEGAVRHGAAPDDRVCRKPPGVDRPGLDGAELQHPEPPPEDPCCEHPLSRIGRSAAPLDHSTGINVEGEGEWNARKHGGTKRRVWRKIHIGIDEQTLEIRAAEFTTSDVGDAPILPELLDQIPSDQEIASVTADGAFDTRKCHDAIAARGAAAIIPPRKNAKPWKPDTAGAVARNEILRTSKRVGRTIWRRWSGYHRRSRAETKMHCLKLLGQRLSARDFDRQVAEFQLRVAVLNSFTALGIPVTEAVG
jgi:hypothetical protein